MFYFAEEEEEAEETVELRPLTVALIKPDAVADGKADDILAKVCISMNLISNKFIMSSICKCFVFSTLLKSSIR